MNMTYPMIPYSVIAEAVAGNTEAVEKIINHYKGYIAKRSLRTVKDSYGNQSLVIDESLQGRLITRLISTILLFEIKKLSVL